MSWGPQVVVGPRGSDGVYKQKNIYCGYRFWENEILYFRSGIESSFGTKVGKKGQKMRKFSSGARTGGGRFIRVTAVKWLKPQNLDPIPKLSLNFLFQNLQFWTVLKRKTVQNEKEPIELQITSF